MLSAPSITCAFVTIVFGPMKKPEPTRSTSSPDPASRARRPGPPSDRRPWGIARRGRTLFRNCDDEDHRLGRRVGDVRHVAVGVTGLRSKRERFRRQVRPSSVGKIDLQRAIRGAGRGLQRRRGRRDFILHRLRDGALDFQRIGIVFTGGRISQNPGKIEKKRQRRHDDGGDEDAGASKRAKRRGAGGAADATGGGAAIGAARASATRGAAKGA